MVVKNYKKYYVLVAKLKESWRYDDEIRCKIQDILMDAIASVNYQMEKTWMCNSLSGKYKLEVGLDFIGGDAVMCLSSSIETLYECIKLLKLHLNAIPVQFAIGNGTWTVKPYQKNINYHDGSAFRHARMSMEHCEAVNNGVSISCDWDAEQEIKAQLRQIEKCATDKELDDLLPKIVDDNVVCEMNGDVAHFKYHGDLIKE